MGKADLPVSLVWAALAAGGMVLCAARPALACADQPYLAAVCSVASSYCPPAYLPADGRSLAIVKNKALFTLIGNKFGGDGQTIFAIPDMRGRVPIGRGPNFPLAEQVGWETVTLTPDQLPSHTHVATFNPSEDGASLKVSATMTVSGTTATSDKGASAPSEKFPYMAGNAVVNMWIGGTPTNLVKVNGVSVTTPGALSGQVTNANAGSSAPISMLPPQQAVTFCIAVEGVYPTGD